MWHYGIVGEQTTHGELWFSMREVYNFEDGDQCTTVEAVPATGETPEEVKENLQMMMDDVANYPVYILDEEGKLEEYTVR